MMSGKHYPMKSDVREKKDAYLLEVDLPGCQKEDIKAYVENGYLHIAASFHQERGKETGRYIRKERYSGSFERSFYVGSEVGTEDLKGAYKHGVLKIRIPKEVTKINETKHIAIAG